MKGKLYLVPNFLAEDTGDRSFPAWNSQIMAHVKHFIVENAKPARRLLKALLEKPLWDEISIMELDKHRVEDLSSELLQPALQGHDIGLISDAGCPGVADPGTLVVKKAHEWNLSVVPLVGPSSILLALMASGLNGQQFRFGGYIPLDKNQRLQTLKEAENRIRNLQETQIFIETPYRNDALLKDICHLMPSSLMLCIASGISGPDEKIRTQTLGEWKKQPVTIGKSPAIFLLGK